jgi:glycosyltransferase involved in cell wall biosynthesis
MNIPKVSIICLCYNQARFVADAIRSVANQTYTNWECIVVNDASTDASYAVLEELKAHYAWLKVIHNEVNLGMCASFNLGMKNSSGEFLIDLASDDVLHPERVEKQVQRLLETGAGVVYSDAWIMNEEGNVYSRFYNEKQRNSLPEGDLFSLLLKGYFICSPTIMFRKSIMEQLSGYDPNLVYEDYDFFIRSSRICHYAAICEALTYRREVKGSNSSKWYSVGNNPHLGSTLIILKRTFLQLKSDEEKKSFGFSLHYHWRQTLFLEVRTLEQEFWELMKRTRNTGFLAICLRLLFRLPLPWSFFYLKYLKIRQDIKKTL